MRSDSEIERARAKEGEKEPESRLNRGTVLCIGSK